MMRAHPCCQYHSGVRIRGACQRGTLFVFSCFVSGRHTPARCRRWRTWLHAGHLGRLPTQHGHEQQRDGCGQSARRAPFDIGVLQPPLWTLLAVCMPRMRVLCRTCLLWLALYAYLRADCVLPVYPSAMCEPREGATLAEAGPINAHTLPNPGVMAPPCLPPHPSPGYACARRGVGGL
jgi:hypothetical protein